MTGPAPRCLCCRHYDQYGPGFSCKAYSYPRRIPRSILWDGERHDVVRKGQVGDFVFEPRSDIEIPEEYRYAD